MKLNIQTTFILRENILFLEEWIAYHVAVGFDKFYLYDNSATTGVEGESTNSVNRYNIDFGWITRHKTDDELEQQFNAISKTFNNRIIQDKMGTKR